MRSQAISWLRRILPLSRQVRIVTALIPARHFYGFALGIARWHGRLIGAMGGNGTLSEVLMRGHWLRELTAYHSFPVPWRLHGRHVLDEYLSRGPVLYFTMHLVMGDMPLRVLAELGYPLPVPIASTGRIERDGKYSVVGMKLHIPVIAANGNSLTRMRSVLQRGGSVACLADRNHLDGNFSASPMVLAGRLHVPVIFTMADIAADRVVDVTFLPAPHPFCESEAAIAKNLEFFEELHSRILCRLGISPSAAATLDARLNRAGVIGPDLGPDAA